MEIQKYHTVRTFAKTTRKIAEKNPLMIEQHEPHKKPRMKAGALIE